MVKIYFIIALHILGYSFSYGIEFNKDVRPILSSKCFACHGPDEAHAAGHLRLDSLEEALLGGDSEKPAVIPGNSEQSEIIKRIFSDDPDSVMPPPDFHATLSEEEKDVLVKWIELGAEYQEHWAFIEPQKIRLPEVGKSASSNPIDRFIEHQLLLTSNEISNGAEREVLIRRLFLDTMGLPPSVSELEHYLSLPVANYKEMLISDLLNSPHYGERMALDWMDAARYADTHGNSRDGTRYVWLWRDWVIKAFNANMPYNEFLKEQLAGDLMEEPTDEQLIATGYNRLHPIIQEGGTIPEENLTKYVIDRVKTVGESMLGVTMACAQCHDHKYDPISQKEYFEFFAFFNAIDDKGIDGGEGRNANPRIQAYSPLRSDEELSNLKQEEARLVQELQRESPAAQKEWEQRVINEHETLGKGFRAHALTMLSSGTPTIGDPIIRLPDSVYRPKGKLKPLSMAFKIPSNLTEVTGVRLTFLPEKAIEPTEQNDPKTRITQGIAVRNLSASFGAAFAPTLDLNNMAMFSKVSASSTHNWTSNAPISAAQTTGDWVSELGPDKEQVITFSLARPINAKNAPYLSVELQILWDRVRNFKVEVFQGNDPSSTYQPEVLSAALKRVDARSVEELQLLKGVFERDSSEKALARFALNNVRKRISFHESKHDTMVMNTAEVPRQTYILNRGVYNDPTEEVFANTPAVFPPLNLENGSPPTRLDLAEWFVRDDHPLTARVAVNRIWSLFFGSGLTVSLADFGSQGSYPSYPELLDWLAVDFRENGWDVKRLVNMILSSKTYQQSSNATEQQLFHDPKNTSLARGPRFRLQAEFIRDHFLKSSGLLQEYVGGESVNPYQPGDLWRQVSHYGSVPHYGQTFIQDHGTSLYRRSIYTFWKRTLPPPNMAAFDAPSREVCSIGRSATNTPLQALVLLNDPQFVEAARALAEVYCQKEGGDEERLQNVFSHITSRQVDTDQLNLLKIHLNQEREYFAESRERSIGLLSLGEKPLSVEESLYDELAAWTNTISLILNLSQTITRY